MNKVPTIQEIVELFNSCTKEIQITEEDAEKNLSEIGVDSIDFISVIVKLEETYDFEFPDEELTMLEMDSLSKILDVMNKVSEG